MLILAYIILLFYLFEVLIICTLLIGGMFIQKNYSNGTLKHQYIVTDSGTDHSTKTNTYRFEHNHPVLAELPQLLYSASISLFIAFFVIAIIQRRDSDHHQQSLKKMINEIKRGVFKGVFQKLIPKRVFKAAKGHIIDSPIIRERAKWIYAFEVLGDDNAIKLTRTISYRVKNLTDQHVNEEFNYAASETQYSETRVTNFKIKADSAVSINKNAQDILTEIQARYSQDTIKNSHPNIALRDIKMGEVLSIAPGKYIDVQFKSEELYKTSSDFMHECQFTMASCLGIEITAQFPKGYEFNVLQVFTDKLDIDIEDEDKKTYHYDGVILKGQGIEFTLSKKPDKGDNND